MKPWYESRTFWFNIAVLVVGAAPQLFPSLQVQLSPAHYTAFVGLVGVANIVLRLITTVAVTLKAP